MRSRGGKKESWLNGDTVALARAFLLLRNRSGILSFFRDLFTPAEIAEFGKRLRAARLLDGDVPYLDIVRETGLSSTTIARVSRWLRKGKGGYRLVLKRLKRGRT